MSEPTVPYSNEPFKPGAARRRLAENLRIIRVLRQWSQEVLAAEANLDRSYIGSVERAERSAGIDALEKLAHALGLSICDLISEPDPQQIAEKLLEVVRNAVAGGSMRVREPVVFYGDWSAGLEGPCFRQWVAQVQNALEWELRCSDY